jgi:hypothetical protein
MLKRLNDSHISEVLGNLRSLDINETPKALVIDSNILTSGGSVAYALVELDKTIAIGGVRELWHGCGEAWLMASEDAKLYPVSLTKAAINILLEADAKGFVRIQCTVDCRYGMGQSWVEKLGFHVESKKEKYGINGDDHFEYVRISDG